MKKTKPQLINRFKVLTEVLEKTRDLGYLSAGQRTSIHMERSALFGALDYLEEHPEAHIDPTYQVSKKIEDIIDRVKKDFKIY